MNVTNFLKSLTEEQLEKLFSIIDEYNLSVSDACILGRDYILDLN